MQFFDPSPLIPSAKLLLPLLCAFSTAASGANLTVLGNIYGTGTGGAPYFESFEAFQVGTPEQAKFEGSSDNGPSRSTLKASADYGTLKVSGTTDLSLGSFSSGSAESEAYADWIDKLNFAALGYSGTGYASVTVAASGLLAAAGAPGNFDSYLQTDASIQMLFGNYLISGIQRDVTTAGGGGYSTRNITARFGNSDIEPPLEFSPSGDSIFGTYTLLLPFLFGEQLDLSMRLSGSVYVSAVTADLGPGGRAGAYGYYDLGNSLYWGGINYITDSNGNRIDDFSVGSESGLDYKRSYIPSPTNQVPEPATLLLLLSMLLGIPAIAKRRDQPPKYVTVQL